MVRLKSKYICRGWAELTPVSATQPINFRYNFGKIILVFGQTNLDVR